MQKFSLFDEAVQFREMGICTIGCMADTKKPVGAWQHLQSRLPDDRELETMYNKRGANAIAIITGKVSGNLEVIDVDSAHDINDSLEDLWVEVMDTFADAGVLPLCVKSPSGGWHVYYRCEKIEPSRKLANRPMTKAEREERTRKGKRVSAAAQVVLIETRGEAGYVLAPPSPSYTILSGSFEAIPTITEDLREQLFTVLRSYNQTLKKEIKPRANKVADAEWVVTSWDEYNADATDPWKNVLTEYGWTFVKENEEREYWLKPTDKDKRGRHSATWHKDKRLFYVFTSSSEFEMNRPYRPAAIRAILEFDGDFTLMNKELRAESYGQPFTKEAKEAINASAKMFDSGAMSVSDVFKVIRAQFEGLDEPTITTVIERAKSAPEAIGKAKKSKQLEQVIKIVENMELRLNQLTGQVERQNGQNITDRDTASMVVAAQLKNSRITERAFMTVLKSDIVPEWDPFMEYIDMVRALPFRDPIGEVLECFEYPAFVDLESKRHLAGLFTNWLCQFIGQQYNEPAELVLVLIGKQHTYKTTFFRELLPERLRTYFATDRMKGDKDSEILMCRKLLILEDELAGQSKREAEYFKSIVSKMNFTIRSPYGRIAEEMKRRCVFAATSNHDDVMDGIDDNRRMIPFALEDFDIKRYMAIDRDELFAQVVALYDEHGAKAVRLDEEQRQYLNETSENFSRGTNEEDIIRKVFAAGDEEDFVSTGEVVARLIEVAGGAMKFERQRVGRVLAKMAREGFCKPQKRKRKDINGDNVRLYGWQLQDVWSDSAYGIKDNTDDQLPWLN